MRQLYDRKIFEKAIENFKKYESCKCGFISKSKETGLCKICLDKEK